MRRNWSLEQKQELIAEVRRRQESGEKLIDVLKELRLQPVTFYRWEKLIKKAPKVREVKPTTELNGSKYLKFENQRLKEIVAQLSIDKLTLQEYIAEHVG